MSDIAVVKKLKVVELKAALSARGLATKGKKDELVKRLIEAMEADEQPASDSNPPDNQEVEEQAQEATEETEGATEESMQEASNDPPDETEDAKEEEISSVQPDQTSGQNLENKPEEEPTPQASSEDANSDWVMVDKPSAGETSAVEDASNPQKQALQESTGETKEDPASEQNNENKEAPVQEPTVDTPSQDVEMKENLSAVTTDASTSNTTDIKQEEKAKETTGEDQKEEEEKLDVMVEVEDEEGEEFVPCPIAEGSVGLDQYSSDLHFIVSNNGVSGDSLSKNGFSYLWAGARANKGAKGGKIGYEVKISGFKETNLPETEKPVNAIRIGWSIENSSLQLGESSLSYGFESTGKVCASSSFFDYGTAFGEGDVIGTYLDLESEPKTLTYTKNGEDLGVAMSLTVNLEEKPLFPHIMIRNVKVECNFGENDETWFPVPEGYNLIQKDTENTVQKSVKPMAEDEKCEVILMVGLPCAGKSLWTRKYCDSNPNKQYNVISLQSLLDRCKLEGKRRRKDDKGHEEMMKELIKALTKLYQLCPKRKRNFIYDQTNVYKKAQDAKMGMFEGFTRRAVVIVPTHDNLRRRTSDAKRRGETIHDVPFADLCDMKCQFSIPEQGEVFEEVIYPELDEKNASKTVRDYHSDGSRAKRTGRDEYFPKKKPRYDDRSRDRNRYGSGGRDRRDDGWQRSGSGYGSYGSGSGGGYNKGGRYDQKNRHSGRGGHRDRDNRRSSGGGGNYRQNSYGSGGSGGSYRGGSGYGSSGSYNQGYGGYGGQNYNYGNNQYGGYNYNQYNQQYNQGNRAPWQQQQQQQQYGSYGTNQTQQSGQWGTGQWGSYNYSTGGYGSGSGGYNY